MTQRDTVWHKYECRTSGARFTSARAQLVDLRCNVSGCSCGALYVYCGATTDVREASAWFRQPKSAA